MKRDCTLWKRLELHSTGLGFDPQSGIVTADDSWWAQHGQCPQNSWWEQHVQGKSSAGKFKDAPLAHEDLHAQLFDGITCTDERTYTPGSYRHDFKLSSDEEAYGAELTTKARRAAKGKARVTDSSPRKRSKTISIDDALNVLVDVIENDQTSRAGVTNPPADNTDPVGRDIDRMMDILGDDGFGEEADEHWYACQLCLKKELRLVFFTLKTREGRARWLRQSWDLYMRGGGSGSM